MSSSSESGHEVYTSHGIARRGRQGAGGEVRRAAQGGADLEAAEHRRGRRRAAGEKLLKLIDALNDHDDVQNVYANFEVSDALVAKMSA